jgi:hypothetical protein
MTIVNHEGHEELEGYVNSFCANFVVFVVFVIFVV